MLEERQRLLSIRRCFRGHGCPMIVLRWRRWLYRDLLSLSLSISVLNIYNLRIMIVCSRAPHNNLWALVLYRCIVMSDDYNLAGARLHQRWRQTIDAEIIPHIITPFSEFLATAAGLGRVGSDARQTNARDRVNEIHVPRRKRTTTKDNSIFLVGRRQWVCIFMFWWSPHSLTSPPSSLIKPRIQVWSIF